MTRCVMAVVATVALGLAAPARGQPAPDERMHLGVSVALGAGGFIGARLVTRDRWVRAALGFGGAVAIGAGKELVDALGSGDPSLGDLGWDVLGAITGVVVAAALDALWGAPSAGGERGADVGEGLVDVLGVGAIREHAAADGEGRAVRRVEEGARHEGAPGPVDRVEQRLGAAVARGQGLARAAGARKSDDGELGLHGQLEGEPAEAVAKAARERELLGQRRAEGARAVEDER